MEIQRIGILGAGTMGHGIAEVFALSGYEAIMIDRSEDYLRSAREKIKTSLEKMIEKGKIKRAEAEETLKRICISTMIGDLKDMELVVEAVSEDEGLKRDLFIRLDSIIKKEAIFASNTSSISITRLASFTSRPDKFIGMHFMNPVPLMRLVEIIRGLATSDATFNIARDLSVKIGKIPVEAKDFPGFIVNRILSQ